MAQTSRFRYSSFHDVLRPCQILAGLLHLSSFASIPPSPVRLPAFPEDSSALIEMGGIAFGSFITGGEGASEVASVGGSPPTPPPSLLS